MTDSTTLVLGATSLALVVLLYVWFAVALAALFRKIGEPVWKAWVPLLNVATVLKIGGFSPWLVLLNIVPIFGGIAFIVVFIVSVHRISVGFGAGAGMTVVGALFPLIWASVLGFGPARWDGEGHGSARASVDEDSAPVRRGREFEGPYVPLIGGWTPERAGDGDAADAPRGVEPAVVSEPVVMPFAAPSGSLADAVPSPSDWAAPSDLLPTSIDGSRRRGGAAPADDAPAPAVPASAGWTPPAPTSVFDVLDALRAEAPATGETPIAGRSPVGPPALADDPARLADSVVAGAPTSAVPPSAWAPPAPAGGVDVEASLPDPTDDDSDAASAPWANPPRRSARSDSEAPDAAAGAPLTRPAPAPVAARVPETALPDEFPELSEAVSAVPDAPDAGAPRSARTSVSALYTQPEVPADHDDDDLDALDRTVVTRRKRIPWALIPPGGAPVDLTSPIVILGRRPAADPAYPDAQLVSLTDETRTVSKTHARLQLRGDTWYVTDLDSTNGVLFATLMGTEVEAPPGEEIEAGERFFLGDAEVRLSRRDV